jgi:hypothetical protein
MKVPRKFARCRRTLGSGLRWCTAAGIPAILCLSAVTLQCRNDGSASTGSARNPVDAGSPTTTALERLNANPDAPTVRDALRTMHSSHEDKASLSSALSLLGRSPDTAPTVMAAMANERAPELESSMVDALTLTWPRPSDDLLGALNKSGSTLTNVALCTKLRTLKARALLPPTSGRLEHRAPLLGRSASERRLRATALCAVGFRRERTCAHADASRCSDGSLRGSRSKRDRVFFRAWPATAAWNDVIDLHFHAAVDVADATATVARNEELADMVLAEIFFRHSASLTRGPAHRRSPPR